MKFNNRNIFISPKANIGLNVRIGDNTVIYDNVEIRNNAIISNNCIIGEPLNHYYHNPDYENPKTIINEDSLIRSHTIIYAGSQFGKELHTGHYVTIREHTKVGGNCSIGTKTDIQGYCEIGNYCRFHSFVNIGQYSTIKDFVFIYPFVVLTNDPKPPSNEIEGPTIDSYTQIASSAVIFAGVKIGKHCLVGANSVVKSNVEDYSCISGDPARLVSDVRKLPIFSGKNRHYPWPYNFSRGMPWENSDYDEWLKSQSD